MKYSIITINYNNKDGLEMTINSVLEQSFQDFEYIIIDGGSTDGSIEVIKKYASQIDCWVSEPDKGVYNAMNKGIRKATGNYLNFMNSGDTYHSSSALETIAKMHSDDDIIIGGYYETGKGVSHTIPPQDVTLLTLLKYTINHQATFIKKSLFYTRLYDESYMIMADAKFNFQSIIIDNCSVKIIEDIIADYDTNGISSNYELYKAERQRFLKELFPPRVIRDYVTMFTPKEVPLVSLLPELKQSPTIQRWVYRFANFLIRLKHSTK
jgi:glycosyltransferase involved in cell wall biosynthesis